MGISIIIPVYNVEPYITDCLQSVMRQTYQGSLECIIVDDCGTDKSLAIAEKLIADYEGSIEFRVLHHEHNRGLSAARNTGMDAARGEYVYFLDSDDWISDDCIEKLAKPLLQEKVDIVIGDYNSVGEPCCPLRLLLAEGKYHEKGISKIFCDQGVYVMAWNKMYRKKFLQKNHLRFEEGKIHEDEILAFEASCLEKSFYVVRSVTYFYRIREKSIMNDDNQYKRISGYAGVLQSIKNKIIYYESVDGIWDFYMFWIKRIFHAFERIGLDEELCCFVDNQVKGFLEVIPGVCYIQNKHYRLLYYVCRKDQTYHRYLYVRDVYSNQWKGRVMRNVLNQLPYRTKSVN